MEPFDFRSSPALPGPAHRAVTAALAVTVPRAGLLLASMLRRPASAEAGELQSTSLGELGSAGTTWFRLDGSTGPGVAVLADAAVVGFADVVMGGPGLSIDREPTDLERQLVGTTLSRALAPVADALAELGIESLSLTPSTPEEAGADAALLGVTIHFDLAGVKGDLVVGLPAALFAGSARSPELPAVRPEVDAALRNVPVTCSVRFAPLVLAADDLDGLAVGDVIRLEHPVGQPLVAEVEGRPLFLAQPGTSGRRLAVEILDLLPNGTP